MQTDLKDTKPDERPRPEAGYAPDALPVRTIGAWMGALAVALVLAVIGLYELFVYTAEREVQRKELVPVAADLLRQRDRDAALLGRYEVVDAKRGRYWIPIGRAQEALAADPALLRPAAPPASAPASQRKEASP